MIWLFCMVLVMSVCIFFFSLIQGRHSNMTKLVRKENNTIDAGQPNYNLHRVFLSGDGSTSDSACNVRVERCNVSCMCCGRWLSLPSLLTKILMRLRPQHMHETL